MERLGKCSSFAVISGYWLQYWATAALNLSLSSISLMGWGIAFQSMTDLGVGINEYFRQFLFVAIWLNWLCLNVRRTGRRIVCVGMARRPNKVWCNMQILFTFLISSSDSLSNSFFLSVTVLLRLYLPVKKQAPLFCTDSNSYVSFFCFCFFVFVFFFESV